MMTTRDWKRLMELILAYGDAELKLGMAIERGKPEPFHMAMDNRSMKQRALIDFIEERDGGLQRGTPKIPADLT